MQSFESLSVRGQLGRLRRLAEVALGFYRLDPERLVTLAHVENTTFRIETRQGERYMLRIHRASGSPFHPTRTFAEVRSETNWLSALRRGTRLAVPEPVPTADGSLLTTAEDEGVPEPRICVLFRWGRGRFFDAGLMPSHLQRVGEFPARLHQHAIEFEVPIGFTRRRIGDVSGGVEQYVAGLVEQHLGPGAAETVRLVLGTVRQAEQELGDGPDVFGLIHADLHQENYLFHRGRVRAIDFDDCGWGFLLYDLAVVLSELRDRSDYPDLRAALLRGYRQVRALPTEHERYLEVFHGLRLVQLTLWFLEQRDHPAFSDWNTYAREGLADLTSLTATLSN
jgi:Ser/Thr protein kinase RdoA (MazF antagonist)